MKQRLIAPVCAALVLAGACEKKEDAAPVTSATPSWRMAPELRIPTATGATDSADVTDIEIAQDTAVYALIPDQKQVVVYDRSGKTRTSLGKGQLSAPTTIGWHNGQIWVWEPSLQKLTRFKLDGTVTGSSKLFQASAAPLQLEAVLSDSTLLAQAASEGDVVSFGQRRLLRVRYDGSVLDTVAVIREQARPLTVGSGNNLQLNTTQPFADQTFVAYSASDGMIVFAHTDTAADKTPVVRVTKVNQVGDTLFSEQIRYKPKPFDAVLVAPAIDRLVLDNRRRWSGAPPAPDEQKRLLRGALFTPRFLPSITGLLVAIDGTILVRREEGTGQVTWTVLDHANGHVIAEQNGPANTRALMAGGPFVFAAEHTPGSIPEVVRYRLLVN